MISEQKIDEWIEIYLSHIEKVTPEKHVLDEEGYKFKAVDTFQQSFNIDAPNLAENLEEAIEQNNLVAGNMYWPRKMLLTFATKYEKETRDALKKLFNTEDDLVKRINETEEIFTDLMERRNKELGESAHSFINLRFISLLLGFHSSNEYDAVKPREWNVFCKYIDDDFRIPRGISSGERYEMLRPCIDALRKKIKDITEIQNIKDQLTRGLEFTDENFRWMTQDIIYVTARIIVGQRGAEKPQQESISLHEQSAENVEEVESEAMEFPLEDYLEHFIVKNWGSIDFGEPLKQYFDDEGAPAQQFPTSEGYIDLLAKDKDDNFVVIELKKGRGNQKVVGQILSYVGWVKKNLAEKNQKVRGIIVTSDGNKALLDAVSMVSDFISVKYYRVNFHFEDPKDKS